MLNVALLGQFLVRLNGQTIDLPSRPVKLLLVFLLINRGQTHQRERLAGILWPDSLDAAARKNLRNAVWRLRQSIGSDFLLADKETVAFDTAAHYRVDVAILENGLHAGSGEMGIEELVESVSAYQGELMPGFYEDWLQVERERLRSVYERLAQQLLDQLTVTHRWNETITWAENWIAQGSAPERAYRTLMLAHSALGDLAGMAAAYNRCAAAVERELAVGLSAETKALYESLSQGERPDQKSPANLHATLPPHRRYSKEEQIAAGGQGEIYQGLDKATGQTVVIKCLNTNSIEHYSEAVSRFTREGEALQRLNHPNIVKLLATYEFDGAYHIVMEYMPGGSLRDLLDRESHLPVEQILNICLDLADALTRAHRLKIIHRDLKPANVLLAADGSPRLADFGIAGFGDPLSKPETRLTQMGTLLGTIDYLSPEACQGLELDARTDIWAFGVMLYELLTGRPPFSGDTLAVTVGAILTQIPPDLETLHPELPVALIDLVYRMLEKDRQERIPSMRLVGAELETILAGVDTEMKSSPRPPATAPRFMTPTPQSTTLLQNNLPSQGTPFVGRDAELKELERELGDSNTRLLTILGPGGMGKTRLALEAATGQLPHFGQGVYFVPLAPLNSAMSIVTAVAEAVGLQFYEGGELEQQLLDYLRQKQLLLVMDNFEHVLGGAGLVGKILRAAPGLKVLATSREKLNLLEETRFRLQGMDLPEWEDEPGHLAQEIVLEYSAVKLFSQSAQRANPGFELQGDALNHAVHICRLVGGMPLGILLAAAWVEMFSLQEIANEISRGLDFLSSELRDLPHRHRSLRAVFESSWKQLSTTEQETFMTLSVFRGGFRREAAQAVAGADLRILITLVNKSLLRRNPRNGRYEMHELLRQYAGEQLDASGHTDRVRMAHCAYFTEFMEVRLERMLGPGQVGALDEIEADFENVRQAWRWAVNQKEHEAVGRATESLFVYSDMRSREHEGEELLNLARERLAPDPEQEPHPSWCMLLLPWYDILLQSKGRPADIEEIRTQAHTALAFANKRGDDLGIAHGLILLAHFADPRQAIQMHDQALTLVPRLDDSFWVRIRIGFSYRALGEYHKAISAFQRSFDRGREIGEKEKMGWCLFNIGETEMTNGDYVSAVTHLRQANPFFHQVGNAMGVIWTNIDLGLMALLNGDFEDARSLVEEAVAVAEKANRSPSTMKHLLLLQGYLSLVEGHYQNGQQRLEEVLSISSPPAEAALGLVFAACGQRDHMLARQRLQLALQSQIPYRTPATADLVLPAAALIFGQEGEWVRAVELLALAHHRPACPKGLLERWPLLTRFQMEVEACLLAEAYAAAWERGLALDMADVEAALRERFQPKHPGPKKDTISLIGTDHHLVEPLTRRELEVLNLIAAGLTNQEIASELVIALGTVKAHTSSIYGKLGVQSRTQAVAKGRELQFLS